MTSTKEHEKIELNEQTPLKLDMDASATNGQHHTEGMGVNAVVESNGAHNESDKNKKGFKLFHFGKGHKHNKGEEEKFEAEKLEKDKETTEKVAEGDEKLEVKDEKNKEKKQKETKSSTSWWNRNCQKMCHNNESTTHPDSTHQPQQGQLSYGLNLVQRDDNGLFSAVDFGYDDIYAEPDSVHSLAGVWRANHCVFLAVRNFFYKLFSIIIALPLAIIFGVLFALVSVLSVFVCVPAGRLISIPANFVFKAWNYIISSVFDPIFHAIGQCFTNVRISRYGINSDPTAVLTA